MRPLDPRLLRYASAARWFLVGGALLGLAQTLVAVAFAWLLSRSISQAIEGRPLEQLADTIGALAAVVVLRAGLVWLLEGTANRGAATVKPARARCPAGSPARPTGWPAEEAPGWPPW
jgi:ATP-binding cassette subfamily C protein CydD